MGGSTVLRGMLEMNHCVRNLNGTTPVIILKNSSSFFFPFSATRKLTNSTKPFFEIKWGIHYIASAKVLMRSNISCIKHHPTKRNKEKNVAGTQMCQMLAVVLLLQEN
jgi:hypothetical protein